MLGASTHTQEEPWKKFLIPTGKTDRLKNIFNFNSLTKEVYDSAYTSKQSRFQSYLDGQRRFRWQIISNVNKVEKILVSYKEGTIPKENINCARYREFPLNVNAIDVAKSQRALAHMNATLKEIKQLNEKLPAKNKELFDQDLKPKIWASNEITFVENFATIREIHNQRN